MKESKIIRIIDLEQHERIYALNTNKDIEIRIFKNGKLNQTIKL